jgi:carboxylesterase type B
MRVQTDGKVGIGTVSPGAKLDINAGTAGSVVSTIMDTSSVGAHNFIFFRANGTTIGSVTSAAGANVAFNTTSDIRLKGGFQPTEGALEKLNQIEVSNFYYLADPQTRMDGFKAQQLYQVVPYAVTKPKTEVDDKGKIIPWLADYSKVVPLITGAVQELTSLFARQEREIASIKQENEQLKASDKAKDQKIQDLEKRLEKLEKSLAK